MICISTDHTTTMKRFLGSLLLFGATQSVLSCDAPSKSGDEMSMQYTGTIDQSSPVGTKGEKFDSSRDRNEPFTFTLGQGQVISGWDNGLVGVCPGDKKILVIQPEDGYGEQGSPPAIPGGGTDHCVVIVAWGLNPYHILPALSPKLVQPS